MNRKTKIILGVVGGIVVVGALAPRQQTVKVTVPEAPTTTAAATTTTEAPTTVPPTTAAPVPVTTECEQLVSDSWAAVDAGATDLAVGAIVLDSLEVCDPLEWAEWAYLYGPFTTTDEGVSFMFDLCDDDPGYRSLRVCGQLDLTSA